MGSSDERSKELEMSAESTGGMQCPNCGARVEGDAKFCTSCSEPLTKEARKEAKRAGKRERKLARKEPRGVEPWARKASDTISGAVSRVPRWVKIWVPLGIVIIIAAIVILAVVASGHTPQAAIERYLGRLKNGDYDGAYTMLSRRSGKFGARDYFVEWQDLQNERLGGLEDFSVRKRDLENRLFGRLVQPEPSEGQAFVATLQYKEKTYDVNIFAVNAGGAWPAQSYKVKLEDGPTRSIIAPLGAMVSVDGTVVGRAVEDQDLKDAMSLGDFPDDIDEAVDYIRTLLRTIENSVIDAKGLLRNLDMVAENVQNTLERLKTTGTSWQQVVDAWDQVVSQSKGFASDVARAAIHIYWIFGGGDDGSVRAEYTRVQSGLELSNLPYGWHEIRVTMPGLKTQTKEFYAPETVTVSLDPNLVSENEFKGVIGNYFAVRNNAFLSLDAALLPDVAGGAQLEQDLARVNELKAQGFNQRSDLLSIKFEKFKFLAPGVATVETDELWNFTVYSGANPVSVVNNQKQKMVYTLQREGQGPWKVTESKQR